jgi:DNA-directed RNA polymerase specialized sigma24 family protein
MWSTAAPGVDQDMATTDLRDELEQLPLDQRRAILLAALFGYTAREIGEIERIPLGTAKTRIRTAMLKLGRDPESDDAASEADNEEGAA